MSLTHIETIELGSSQSSITFSSIPQDYDDLIVLISARSSTTTTGTQDEINLQLNATNVSSLVLFGTGSAAGSLPVTEEAVVAGSNTTANTFGNSEFYLSNYKSGTVSLSSDSVFENNATSAIQGLYAGLYSVGSAVTSAVFTLDSGGNFVAGTTISLYGVTAGGDGTVTTS